MPTYFKIPFEFDKKQIFRKIDDLIQQKGKGQICVVDGNALATSQEDYNFCEILNQSYINISDSGWIPVYLKLIYGKEYQSYCGTDFFMDTINQKKHTYYFLGSSDEILEGLRKSISLIDSRISEMPFVSLPFCGVDDFEYQLIANEINERKPDFIWISLGAPKQEIFASKLLPYLKSGIAVGIGAVFNFKSGIKNKKRAPAILVTLHLEWAYRLIQEPRKTSKKVFKIIAILPKMLFQEYKRRKISKS